MSSWNWLNVHLRFAFFFVYWSFSRCRVDGVEFCRHFPLSTCHHRGTQAFRIQKPSKCHQIATRSERNAASEAEVISKEIEIDSKFSICFVGETYRYFWSPFFLRRSCRLLNVMYIYIYLFLLVSTFNQIFQIGQIWTQRLRKRWEAETGNYRICQIFGGRSGRYEGVSIKCRSWLVIVRSHVSNENNLVV